MSEREPITTELRETIRSLAIDDSVLTIGGDDFHRLCDAIDAVHAALERENAELYERLAALDKRSESMHEIGSATITVTPRLDWTGVARELRSIADTLEGDAE